MDFFVGCSGWYYKHWKDIFYNVSQKKWLSFYASKFRTVELNSTFYRFPNDKTVELWLSNTPENFIFSLKVSRLVTHIKRFHGDYLENFYNLCKKFGDKLGCVLFQLPPNFTYKPEYLRRILASVDPDFMNVFEFRHKSWLTSEVYDALRENGISFCIVSSPKMPGDFIRTSENIYIRFHGSTAMYASDYSRRELASWAGKISNSGAKKVFAYFNNDVGAFAPKNALELLKLLGR